MLLSDLQGLVRLQTQNSMGIVEIGQLDEWGCSDTVHVCILANLKEVQSLSEIPSFESKSLDTHLHHPPPPNLNSTKVSNVYMFLQESLSGPDIKF